MIIFMSALNIISLILVLKSFPPGAKDLLHLTGIDVFSAGNNHLLKPICNVQVSIFIKKTDIAWAEPPLVRKGFLGPFGIIQITFHYISASDADLPFMTLFQYICDGIESAIYGGIVITTMARRAAIKRGQMPWKIAVKGTSGAGPL